jgi:hypothetical protein
MLCIGIEQPADHALILRMMFPRLTLEKLDASLAQRNGDLDAFVPKDQFFWPGKEVRNGTEVSEGFGGVSDSLAHRFEVVPCILSNGELTGAPPLTASG